MALDGGCVWAWNRSGWLQLLILIPVIGWILVIVWWVQDGKVPNRYCADTQELTL